MPLSQHIYFCTTLGDSIEGNVNQKYNSNIDVYITTLVHALVRFLIFSLLISYGVLNSDAVLF